MRRLAIAVGLLISLWSTQAFGQSTYATVSGTVEDASGALIPGVSVTATNNATGVVTTVISNESGAYNFCSHAVEVEVDPETGKFTILDYAAASDAGTVVFPIGAEGQNEATTRPMAASDRASCSRKTARCSSRAAIGIAPTAARIPRITSAR